jgi:hypothetical protein
MLPSVIGGPAGIILNLQGIILNRAARRLCDAPGISSPCCRRFASINVEFS